MSKELGASAVTVTVPESVRDRAWHVDSSEGQPAHYPMEGNAAEVRQIVKATSEVQEETAEFLKALALAGTIALAAYILSKQRSV